MSWRSLLYRFDIFDYYGINTTSRKFSTGLRSAKSKGVLEKDDPVSGVMRLFSPSKYCKLGRLEPSRFSHLNLTGGHHS